MSGFTLYDASGAKLLDLPTVLRPVTPLGAPDPFTWDQVPGGKRFALGTGLGPVRPVFELTGTTWHRSVLAAAEYGAMLREAVYYARSLWWTNIPLADLDADYPGAHLMRYGAGNYDVQHTLTLNVGAPITPLNFTRGAALPTPTTPGENTAQPVLTTVTVYVEGVPVEVQVWRQP